MKFLRSTAPLYLQMLRLTSGQWSASLNDVPVLPILYRSDHFVVVDKRFDLKVNSDDPADAITVATLLQHQFPHLVDDTAFHGFRFVHRLDYATSGCLCVALTKKGARWGNKAFAKRYVTKHYLALVRGHVNPEVGRVIDIDIAIGDDSSATDCHRMCSGDSIACKEPRESRTTFVLLEHGVYDGEPASKVLLIPHTGRTHQLRVHCRHIGHCIVGDYTYSDRTDTAPYRMMLHALHLVIPMKREIINVKSPDLFVTENDDHWKSLKTFTTYDSFVGNVLDRTTD